MTDSSTITEPTPATDRGVLSRLYRGETSIDFFGRRWWGLGASIGLLVLTVVSLSFSGLNLSLDFTGGVVWEVPSATLTEDQARQILNDNEVDSSAAKIQEFVNRDTGVRTVSIQVGDQTDDTRRAVQDALAAESGVEVDEVSTSSVSSTWGSSITAKAIRALIVFMVLVALFISWRLEWQMAAASIAAMIHDVVVSVGIYSLLGFEVTPATVVAFLTILGYSLYDTIVVFDKVKENQVRFAPTKASYADIMNVSMNQVLMRSLNTTLSSVLPVLSLFVVGSIILGAVSLREFALALLVGLLIGSYSSIFIASPIVAMVREREPRYRPYRGRWATGDDLRRLVLGGLPGGRRDTQRPVEQASAAETRAALVDPSAVLTHTPRPRKKKRRA
ncbi:MAG: protein translocase subunit SecF [Ilumatobacteraceae bacterium]